MGDLGDKREVLEGLREVEFSRACGETSSTGEGQHQGWARVLSIVEKPLGAMRAGATGSLDRRSWLCALRVCSVLHNQGKLLKWGEPEGDRKSTRLNSSH